MREPAASTAPSQYGVLPVSSCPGRRVVMATSMPSARYPHPPLHRVAVPGLAGRHRKLARAEVPRAPARIHIGSGGIRVRRAVLAAQAEQHQLRAVGELQAEPVPAALFGRELVREELVVHPRQAFHREALPVDLDFPGRCQPRERNVVRRPSLARGLLAHAVHPVYHRRLLRAQIQREAEAFRHGLQPLARHAARRRVIQPPARLPVAVPHTRLRQIRPGQARSGAVQPFAVQEAAPVDVAERQVRQPGIAHVPHAGRPFRSVYALAEECEFESKAAPLGGCAGCRSSTTTRCGTPRG